MKQLKTKSDGYFHTQLTLQLSILAAFSSMLFMPFVRIDQSGSLLIGAILGCLTGIILSPDLDQTSITVSEWYVLKIPIVGIIIGPIFIAFWLPYSRIFKHRSFWTHTPFVGTMIRLVYLMVLISIYSYVVPFIRVGSIYISTNIIQYIVDIYHPLLLPSWISWFYGLCISDTGHWLRDKGILV